jgi:RNA polymerase sigma-70 factor, ECF subfamily
MQGELSKVERLLQQARQGDRKALEPLFGLYREKLRRMVWLRLDRRLSGRIEASDVIQEAYTEAWQRFDEYLKNPRMPLYFWLRFLTGQKLLMLHRRHLVAQARNASREVSLYRGGLPETTSAALAAHLVGHQTSPTKAAVRSEIRLQVEEALDSLEPMDREVLALRHFEQLSNAETAFALEISETTASKRYIRALARLKKILITVSEKTEPRGP